jgi:glyoxylase-like metal-dependent hydrolase (beta-lactamase superfamily II)
VNPLAACAASAASQAATSREFEDVHVPMTVVKVSAHSYYVQGQAGVVSTANEGFNSNAGFVVTGDGVVVFDTLGTPALGMQLRRLIARTTSQPVKRVILSHYHSDHFYGVQAFQRQGVDIWAHALVRDYLATDAPAARLAERRSSLAPWVNDKTRVVAPTRYLGEDTRFAMGGLHFRILHVGPAHTPEDLMLMVDEDRVLFAGDLVFAGRVPFAADGNVGSWIESLGRVLPLKPRIIVTGHGPYSTDAVADLTQTHDYLAYLRQAMKSAFDDGVDFETAYAKADWSRFAALPAFEAANRRNAYQAYLNVEQDALLEAKQERR